MRMRIITNRNDYYYKGGVKKKKQLSLLKAAFLLGHQIFSLGGDEKNGGSFLLQLSHGRFHGTHVSFQRGDGRFQLENSFLGSHVLKNFTGTTATQQVITGRRCDHTHSFFLRVQDFTRLCRHPAVLRTTDSPAGNATPAVV